MNTRERTVRPLFWIPALLTGLFSPALLGGQFRLDAHTFTVPEGFEVQRVAGPPLVDRPIEMDFDEQGRLYVTDSSGSNDKVDKQLQERPHRVVRLEDTDGDGQFDRRTVFADKMMFPEGAMWHNGSLYVSAPPSIWKLTDTDGDGIADKREEWFQAKTLTGCANDLHGPYLGLDGWIYWCKGAFAEQRYTLPTGKPFASRAAHMFRVRPDGSGIEPVMTGGMDNPVGVVFMPTGERIFSTTFFEHPGGGKRDGLVHAIYGGVYGKPHDVLDGHKRTGELMPVLTHLGPAAPCGLARYESRAFGDEYQDNLFTCHFNLHKVTRHVLEPAGATFRSQDSDFLVSDNADFHPTDVLEDADGSLLVIDTGGWYKLCCPTSQLWKPDVLGAIYRVKRKEAPRWPDPRGLKLAWNAMQPGELAKLLSDERPSIRHRAQQQLARRGAEIIPALAHLLEASGSVEARRNLVWVLTRMAGQDARSAVRKALGDAHETVRHAAIHSISVHRDSGALEELNRIVETATPALRRSAAEALGRFGDSRAVESLLKAASAARHDRVLEHSICYSLIEIGAGQATLAGLRSDDEAIQRAAMIALDQMDASPLTPDMVTPWLVSTNTVLRQTASWIIRHRAEWAESLVGFFRQRLADSNLVSAERDELAAQLAQFARSAPVQQLITETLHDKRAPRETQLTALRAIARASLKEAPADWLVELARVLTSNDTELLRQSVAAARSLNPQREQAGELIASLVNVARNASQPADVRLDALAAVPGGLSPVEPAFFEFLRDSTAPANPVVTRSIAAGVLARARLSPEQLLALTETIKTAGPLEVPKLLSPFSGASNEVLGVKLVSALKQSGGLAGLRAETLRPHLTNFPETVRQQGEQLLASLNVDAARQRARLDELAVSLKDGDIRRGQAIFNGPKAACASCHAIGYLGGKMGPDLTRIGTIRTERDLLESIVYPSASFVRSFESYVILTKSGDAHTGILRKDAADEIILGTGPDTEVRLARSDVAEMRPGSVSIMPQGLDEQLTRQELADLLAFLKATRW